MSERESIILAAGKGTRMDSDLPKVCHPCFGEPMIVHPIRNLRTVEDANITVVVGEEREKVKKELPNDIRTVTQDKQLGTGHAVEAALEKLSLPGNTTVIVTCGDIPGVRAGTFESMFEEFELNDQDILILTSIVENPSGYGRVVKNEKGDVIEIVEEVDCTPSQAEIQEINTGIICAEVELLEKYIGELESNNNAEEYYLTDIIKLVREQGGTVSAKKLDDFFEAKGINTRKQLVDFEKEFYRRKNNELLQSGVTIRDPDRVKIGPWVEVSSDVEIEGDVKIHGDTVIGESTKISGSTEIIDSQIGSDCIIERSKIREAEIGDNTRVGPFCNVRPNTFVGNNVRLGNFVEIKKSRVENDTNIAHLSYVGDAEVGQGVNVGAGTITCNYDGIDKHQTTIKNGVFIGSNTEIVAPVTLGERSFIGAGSTITQDVAKGSLALSRVDQETFENWVEDVWENRKNRSETHGNDD